MQTKIIISAILLISVILGFTSTLDTHALALHDKAFERSVASFAIAKALNGVISLIQGTELSFMPVGVGVTFSVGEVLDPMNDLIERFSWVMLLSSIALGIQKLLLLISTKLFMQIALGASALITVSLIWLQKPLYTFFSITLRLFMVLFLLRWSVVVFVMLETMTFNSLLAPAYQEALLDLNQTNSELQAIEHHSKEDLKKNSVNQSWFDSAKENINRLNDSFEIQQKLQQMQERIDLAQKQIIELATIFVFQTILLPLLFLWLLITLIRWSFAQELGIQRVWNKIRA
jgi:hypothetical protein